MIEIRVQADEVLFRLDQLPRRVREELAAKFQTIFARVESEIAANVPGKYIDPSYIQSGVDRLGSTMIGFVEIGDKPGVYAIYPTKANVLRFMSKSGDLVRTRRVLNHPYLKGAPVAERYLIESKPWVLEELNDAVIEAVNAR